MAKNSKQKPKVREIKYAENNYYNILLIVSFFILIIFTTSYKITGDDDVFWHLATGRYVVENLHVPSADIFGYMTQGQEWMPFEWGWDVLTYAVYSVSGLVGLSLLRTLLFILIFLLYIYLLRKFKVSYTFIIFMLTLLLFSIFDRLSPRPHLITYLFFVSLLLIFSTYRYFNRENYKILFLLPVIFLIWSNMHMGVIAGMFMLGIYVFAEIIYSYTSKGFKKYDIRPLEKSEIIRLVLITASCVLIMLMNPNGFSTYIYAYNHTKMKMLETINEWRSPFGDLYSYSKDFVVLLYKFFLFSGILVLIYSYKKKDIFPALLYLGFAVYSVRAMRFTVDYNFILFPFIVVSIYYFVENLKSVNVKLLITQKPFLKIVFTLFFLYLTIPISNNDFYLKFLQYYRITGFGINGDFIPVQMFDFMKRNNVPEIGTRIFNHFGTGGFFVWNFPGKQNFIDSRNLNDDIFNKYNSILSKQPGFEKKLDEYKVDYIIYLAPDLVRAPQEMESSIISYLSKSQKWKLIFWDDKSFLWVRNEDKFKELIDKYDYKYFTPYTTVYFRPELEKGINQDLSTVKKEIERIKAEQPNSVFLSTVLTQYQNRIK